MGKLDSLINENLITNMEHGFAIYRLLNDPYSVMSYKWIWNRWIRN